MGMKVSNNMSNGVKKIIFLILLFYFLTLLQTSFLVHFNVFGIVPNFVFITVILINLFTPHHYWRGVGAAFIGGLYLDIFSLSSFWFFGLYTLILVAISLFIKFILKKHVSLPVIKKGRWISFIFTHDSTRGSEKEQKFFRLRLHSRIWGHWAPRDSFRLFGKKKRETG